MLQCAQVGHHDINFSPPLMNKPFTSLLYHSINTLYSFGCPIFERKYDHSAIIMCRCKTSRVPPNARTVNFQTLFYTPALRQSFMIVIEGLWSLIGMTFDGTLFAFKVFNIKTRCTYLRGGSIYDPSAIEWGPCYDHQNFLPICL